MTMVRTLEYGLLRNLPNVSKHYFQAIVSQCNLKSNDFTVSNGVKQACG